MGQPLRRLIRSLGVAGSVGLILAVLAFALVVRGGVSGSGTGTAGSSILRVVLLLIAGLVLLGFQWGVYESPVHTRHYREVLDPLLASTEEFVVVLRPFGSDGEVLLPWQKVTPGRAPRWYLTPVGTVTPTVTLEQVVAAAARSSLGVRAFALVDQTKDLAPPGPVYLRAGMDEWQIAAGDLIRRAHTIAVILPPGQPLRESMEWEIAEIIRTGRGSRVVVVLPPPDRERHDHPAQRDQAALLLAALATGTSRLTQVPAVSIAESLDRLPETVTVIKVVEGGGVLTWYIEGRRRARVTSRLYVESLGEAIQANEHEVQHLGFRARYPRAQNRGQHR
jgi:hypothetical protein